ncbi:MAG: DUF6125 family protein [Dehalococcoidales bacterium]
MIGLTAEQVTDYYRRSYNAVDGLWFMKVEKAHGFETALAADKAVWQVLPKIQARKFKELAKLGNGLKALREVLAAKLTLDGYAHRIEAEGDDGAFTLTIEDCPWLEVMSRTGRSHLAGDIGKSVCAGEYVVWASEFGTDIRVKSEGRICEDAPACRIRFSRGGAASG